MTFFYVLVAHKPLKKVEHKDIIGKKIKVKAFIYFFKEKNQ